MDVGVEIGKYKVVEHIGRGGMADVWSARDMQLNRMVAIKTIAHGLSQDVDPVGLFKEEAQTIAQMEHPNILPIYDFGEFEGQLYIVMRYVAGGSLEDILNRGPMALNEVLRVGQAIASALDYAHSSNIIHLDLKPPNVLLDSHSSPYLADFGLATKLDPEGKANNPGSGTLLYMAPEQLTAEVIDKRADLYSFCIMLFHMMTGELPFEASVPMALKQLQKHEEMPEIDLINSDIPSVVTDILRQGTSVNPDDRPATLIEIIEEIRESLAGTTALGLAGADFALIDEKRIDDEEIFEHGAPPMHLDPDVAETLREAADIYVHARQNWGGGNGRFLLGVTHFMLMNDYYTDADYYELILDEAGRQMLLRGALEYDQGLEFWWNSLDDNNRRWVCLHALRSGNAPARVRSMYRLETLTDSSPPQIPKLVAQALQVETDEEARIAALKVLGSRSKLLKQSSDVDVRTEYHGRVLTTMTRIGVQLSPPTDWRELVYTAEIDLLIAETALDYAEPAVAEYAARTVGRMRSKLGVQYIADQQKAGRKGSLRALALIRDEAPSLPPGVGLTGRIYAWSANSLRRMFEHPMGVVWRYVAALVGGWIAMGLHLYAVQDPSALLAQNRWANIIAMGLVFGAIVGFSAVFAGEFSTRLEKFWPWWGRIIAGLAFGTFWATFAWWSWKWFFQHINNPGWNLIVFGGFSIALGYSITASFKLRSWFAVPLSIVLTYFPIYITYQVGWNYQSIPPFKFDDALLAYWENQRLFTVALPFAVAVAIGGNFTGIVSDVGMLISLYRRSRAQRAFERSRALPVVPNVREYEPAVRAMQLSHAGNLRTELDLSLGLPDLASRLEATQQDAQMGEVRVGEPVMTELDVNQGEFGAPDEAMKTEMDINLGHPEDEFDEVDEAVKPKSHSLNVGTGIRLPPRQAASMETELDVNMGDYEEEAEPDMDSKPETQSLNVGTGIRLPSRKATSMETELDVNMGDSEEVSEDSEVRSPRFFAGALDTDAKTSMDTDMDPAAAEKEEEEVRSPRFFAASQPKVSQDRVDTEVSPAKADADDTESRKPRFFAASQASKVNQDDLSTDISADKPSGSEDDTQSRKPRFFAASMNTEVDATEQVRDAEKSDDASEKTTTQSMNVKTSVRVPHDDEDSSESQEDALDAKTDPDFNLGNE